MPVTFEDFSIQVNGAMDDAVETFLIKASKMIQSAVERNTRSDSGDLRGKWDSIIDASAGKATIGNPLENAIWEEFGTGEYSTSSQGGRMGAWYVPVEKVDGKKKPSFNGKVIIVYGKDGQQYYKTNGKEGTKAFQKAYDSKKNKVIKLAQNTFKEKLN